MCVFLVCRAQNVQFFHLSSYKNEKISHLSNKKLNFAIIADIFSFYSIQQAKKFWILSCLQGEESQSTDDYAEM